MKISLIVPCYNEELNIQKGVLDKIDNFTKNDERFIEVMIVDDGSDDKSKEIIKNKYLSLFPKFHLIENAHQGKAYAVITGIKKAKSDYVMFCDFDLATPIEEAEKLIKNVNKDVKIVIGSRNRDRKDAPIFRKIMSYGSVIVKSMVLGLQGINDTQCGFKLFNKKTAIEIINSLRVFHNNKKIFGASVSAGFDLEFLFIAAKKGYKIVEVPVLWKYAETRRVDFIKDTYESLRDILLIKYYDIRNKY
jgi:dolichyl-phosphate beta-glucosyltransferase